MKLRERLRAAQAAEHAGFALAARLAAAAIVVITVAVLFLLKKK